MLADVQRERAGVDAVDAGDAIFAEVVVEALLAPPVARLREVADDEAGEEEPATLNVLGVDAVVADLRSGENDELPGVGGIGQNLLVARHASVEDHFAQRILPRAERDAVEDRPVIQGDECGAFPLRFPFCFVVHASFPWGKGSTTYATNTLR